VVELFQCKYSILAILRQARIVEFTQGVVEGRKFEILPNRFGKRICAVVCDRKTLFDEPPQTPPSKTSKSPVNGHDPLHLVTDFFDLRIDQLERAAPCLANLTVAVEFWFVSEPRVDPPVIEPYDLEVSVTIINETVDN